MVELREGGWKGLPPPPAFTTGKQKPAGEDPTATPTATSLGLPKQDPEPRIPQTPPPESPADPETDTVPTPLVTHSPSMSISTLSDFTIADTPDDESPIDPEAITTHSTFYLEDGNAEVLCGNTLFRVHTSILSLQSPALRRMFAQTSLASAESPNGCPRILSSDTATDFITLLKMVYLLGYVALLPSRRTVPLTISAYRFPERNKVPDFATFSSLLRITAKYELLTVRSQLLEVVRDAYPETFQGLAPSKPLGESVFSGPTPHPNEVLNLFAQQELASALPMAYYMAARRGLSSLMDRRLPQSATLPPDILQSAIGGLMILREVELNETHRLIFEPKDTRLCSMPRCPSRTPTNPAALDAYRKVLDHIVGSSQLGTKLLQVPEFYEERGDDSQCVSHNVCSNCVERWESGHADLRKKVWARLPDVFGLKG